ncbi:uncharacterized protein [Asterias amurensis]|uniref:uncharacterized protein n=1 Tax=Asterias amurensis TaxID=7602 RepID=UPI003AB202F4
MSSKGPCRRGHSSSDSPCVENATLVPTSVRTHSENSSLIASSIGATEVVSQQPISSNVENLAVSRMEAIGQSLSARGISQQVSSVILSSWLHGTNAQFNSAWNRWSRWCVQRQVDPVRAPLADILEFLHSLFQQGLQYRTINVYRSAISSAHVPVEGAPVGQHSLVSRFFKGIFNIRPPQPKYCTTWDTGKVLRYILSLPRNRELSLRLLTLKTAMLVALVTAGRCSSLIALDLQFMQKTKTAFVFTLVKPTKCFAASKTAKKVTLTHYPPDSKLCVVKALEVYLQRTKPARGQGKDKLTSLFLSFVKPVHAVVSATIARWLRTIMASSGIDVSHYRAHSTRGATTSAAARAEVSTAQILKAADWSSESTFTRFYRRDVTTSEFQTAVLASVKR